MISAHKIIDWIKKDVRVGNPVFGPMPDEQIKDLMNSIKFDAGDFDELPPSEPKPVQMAPFPLCYIEIRAGGIPAASLLREEGGVWEAHVYLRTAGVIRPSGIMVTNILGDSGFQLLANKGGSFFDICGTEGSSIDALMAALSTMQAAITRFLSCIECSNVEYRDVIPSRIMRRRRKNKTPLFEYKELVIRTNYSASKSRGKGTHASPRVHLRRGHIRRLKDGRKIWVQPCVVGNKKMGVIHKDYTVRNNQQINGDQI